MNIEPSEAGAALIARVDEFVTDVVAPLERELKPLYARNPDGIDESGRKFPEIVSARNRVFRESARAGFLSAHLPQSVGGGGLSHVDIVLLREAVFRHGLGLSQYVVNMTSRGPNPILMHVRDERREVYLDPVVRGEKTTCLALTEPGAGSDAMAIEATAVRDGDHWIINGVKRFIGNGPYADFAQVAAYTSKPERRGHGVTLFAVDLETPGISREMVRTIVASGDWCEIRFENVRVPDANMIGEEGRGLGLLLGWLEGERIEMGGQCVGLGHYLIDLATRYARGRMAFGRPIGVNQYVQGHIVEATARNYASRFAVLGAAARKDAGERTRLDSSIAKYLSCETLYDVADRTMQVFGGHGVDKALPVEKVFRLARSMRVYEGTSEIQKVTIARELGLPMA